MDIIFELMKDLWESLNPTTFWISIGLIIFITYMIVNFFMKSSNRKVGILDIIKGIPKEDAEIKEIKDKLSSLVTDHAESISNVLNAIQELTNSLTTLDEKIDDLALLKGDIGVVKIEMIKEIDDMKIWVKMHDVSTQQSDQALKDLLQRTLDILSKINSQLEKIDEFVHDAIPEFRINHKDINKGITELSKDIALIERTIQNQISTAGVTLR